VILEYMHILKASVFLQIHDSFSIHIENERQLILVEGGQGLCVGSSLDHDLMGAGVSHLVEDALGPFMFRHFDSKNRIGGRETANKPCPFRVFELPYDKGGLMFITGAKGTDIDIDRMNPFVANHHPVTGDGIFS
jgi:hypothetical protein